MFAKSSRPSAKSPVPQLVAAKFPEVLEGFAETASQPEIPANPQGERPRLPFWLTASSPREPESGLASATAEPPEELAEAAVQKDGPSPFTKESAEAVVWLATSQPTSPAARQSSPAPAPALLPPPTLPAAPASTLPRTGATLPPPTLPPQSALPSTPASTLPPRSTLAPSRVAAPTPTQENSAAATVPRDGHRKPSSNSLPASPMQAVVQTPPDSVPALRFQATAQVKNAPAPVNPTPVSAPSPGSAVNQPDAVRTTEFQYPATQNAPTKASGDGDGVARITRKGVRETDAPAPPTAANVKAPPDKIAKASPAPAGSPAHQRQPQPEVVTMTPVISNPSPQIEAASKRPYTESRTDQSEEEPALPTALPARTAVASPDPAAPVEVSLPVTRRPEPDFIKPVTQKPVGEAFAPSLQSTTLSPIPTSSGKPQTTSRSTRYLERTMPRTEPGTSLRQSDDVRPVVTDPAPAAPVEPTRPIATHQPEPIIDWQSSTPASAPENYPSAPEPIATPSSSSNPADDGQPPQTMKIAFTATLRPVSVPLPEETASLPVQSAARERRSDPETPEEPGTTQSPTSDESAHSTQKPVQQVTPSRDAQPKDAEPRGRKPELNAAADVPAVSPSASNSRPTATPDDRPPAPSQASEPLGKPESAPQSARAVNDPPAEPNPPVAAHDIKLQVGGDGSPRVELRVTERGGDIQVAVRTPDARLAGDLRQDLPSLAARLEQSGYRAETWHPATVAGRWHLADPQFAGTAQDAHGQPHQNGRDPQSQQQEQKRKNPAKSGKASPSNDPGKDFEWLLSSLR